MKRRNNSLICAKPWCLLQWTRASLFTLAIGLVECSSAQFLCFQPTPPPDSPQLPTACGASINYAPLIPEQTPVKFVRVSIHCFQKDDGTGNFTNAPADVTYLNNLISAANFRLSHLGVLNMGTTPYIQDARVAIVLEHIYYHHHSVDWAYADAGAMWTKYVVNDYDGLGITADDKNNVEHIFLSGSTGTGGGRASGIGTQGWISHVGWYPHYQANGAGSYSWGPVGNFIHELGHALGLTHNFHGGTAGYQCDACTDNDPTGLPCPIQGSSSNYMDYWPGGYNFSNPDPGFSQCQLGRVHYYLDGNVGTIWRTVKTDHCTYMAGATLTISASATWESSKKLKGDLIIAPGATLTVRCRVHMPYGASVIVKQGGRLVVDGGQFTNLCGQQWSGIQVWGTTAQHQFGTPIPQYQGLVVLKNGAIIEHAREGVQLWKPNDWTSIGGVIQVDGTTALPVQFLNCRRAVSFLAYQNFNPSNSSQKRPNKSYFKFCDFVVDDNYRGGNDFYAHVSMWKVDGIRFTGCNFKNLQTTIAQSNLLGQGIISLDAEYTVTGVCTPAPPCCNACLEANLRGGNFIGLDHGIEAHVAETDRNFVVSGCHFQDNVVGVWSDGVNSWEVTRSYFKGGGRNVALAGSVDYPALQVFDPGVQFPVHRGVMSLLGHGFRIEENHFEGSAGRPYKFAGAWINSSGANNDQVYKNDALNTDYGFLSEGKCFDNSNGGGITGLQFLCNTNYNPGGKDLWEKVYNVQGQFTEQHSMRTQQGSATKPAEGSFTHELFPADASDLRNSTNWIVNYWWNQNNTNAQPQDVTLGYVNTAPTASANTCPSNFILGHLDHPFSPTVVTQFRQQFTTTKAAYTTATNTYNSSLDAGNTATLKSQVGATTTATALYNLVNPKAPWLSEAVLRAVVQRNLLNGTQLTTVLVANPDATKQNGFLDWLQTYPPTGAILGASSFTQIRNSWTNVTARTAVERTMGQNHVDMSYAGHALIQDWKADTLRDDNDSVLVRWQQMPNLGARYGELLTRLQRGEYTQATALATGLSTTYKLNKSDSTERQDALDYINAVKTIRQAGRNLQQLTTTDKASIRAIAQRTTCTRAVTWAQSVLCFGYGECYAPCSGGPGTTRMLLADDEEQIPTSVAAPRLLLFPNPTHAQVNVAYALPDEHTTGQLVLYGVDGREIKRQVLGAGSQQAVVDLAGLASGIYQVELQAAGERLAVQRLAIEQ